MQPNDLIPINLNKALNEHDEQFIETIYQWILGRKPDISGRNHFLNLLRAGESKIEIIGRLRYSREGRTVGTQIQGLPISFILQRIYRLPIIGRLFHIISCIYHLPETERNQRTFDNQYKVLYSTNAQEINRLLQQEKLICSSLSEVANNLKNIASDISPNPSNAHHHKISDIHITHQTAIGSQYVANDLSAIIAGSIASTNNAAPITLSRL